MIRRCARRRQSQMSVRAFPRSSCLRSRRRLHHHPADSGPRARAELEGAAPGLPDARGDLLDLRRLRLADQLGGPDRLTRHLILLGCMAVFFVVALAIPRAFSGSGTAFGLAYLAVVLVHLGMFACWERRCSAAPWRSARTGRGRSPRFWRWQRSRSGASPRLRCNCPRSSHCSWRC
jgi:Bacterial low temperature requirement A protein (LtrA)